MSGLILFTPFLIVGSAALLLWAIWSVNRLTQRTANHLASRPRFTTAERARLRALRERYQRDRDRPDGAGD